jgi:hypothetical protein
LKFSTQKPTYKSVAKEAAMHDQETRVLSEREIDWNMKCVKDAVAQQRLEGLEPSKEGIADLERVARGEMTFDELMENTKRRYTHGKVFQKRPLS